MIYTYKKITMISGDIIIVRSDNANIPICLDNPDYQAYLAWVAEGNVAEEWVAE
jgi:hypothetical protein